MATNRKGYGVKEIAKTTFAEKMKIVRWLEAHKEELKATRPNRHKVCEDIRKELSIVLGAESLRRIAVDAELDWNPRPSHYKNGITKNTQRELIRAALNQCAALQSALLTLFSRLNEQPPDELSKNWPHPPQQTGSKDAAAPTS